MKNVMLTRRFRFLVLLLSASSICITEAAITSTGDVTPAFSGPGIPPWSPATDLIIGNTSAGTFEITTGSRVTNTSTSNVFVGLDKFGFGTVRLDALAPIPVPTWDIDSTLFAGVSSNSTLSITSGNLTTRDLIGGLYGTSQSTISVSGENASLNVEEKWIIGEYGDNQVTVSGGAQASAKDTYIGQKDAITIDLQTYDISVFPSPTGQFTNEQSQREFLTDRMGEDVTIELFLPIDQNNPGRFLVTLPEGRTISDDQDFVSPDPNVTRDFLGEWDDRGDPNNPIVFGNLVTRKSNPYRTDPVFDAIDPNIHQRNRAFSVFTVLDDPDAFVSNSQLTVQDPGSVFTSQENLYIGAMEDLHQGTGTLVVENGGTVNSKNTSLAKGDEGRGHARVTGGGSAWHNSETLKIGDAGRGTLQLSAGAQVTSRDAYLGYDVNSVGQATVSGAGTRLEIENAFRVGYKGTGTLTVQDKATVSALDFSVGGDPCETGMGATSVNDATISVGQWLKVGSTLGSTLDVSEGARVTSDKLGAGHDPNHLARINIDGAGSTLVTNELFIGEAGNALFSVTADANVVADYARVGQGPPLPLPPIGDDETPFLDLGRGLSGVLDIRDGLFQARQLDIATNGLLRADGDVAVQQTNVKGTMEIGNSIGTATFHGDVSLEQGSQLNVELDNAGNSDRLIVTGKAQINGGTLKTFSDETITDSQKYTIIQADEVAGPGFDNVDTLDSVFLRVGVQDLDSTSSLRYGQKDVILSVTIVPFDDASVADTANRRGLGKVLQKTIDTGGNALTNALQEIRSPDGVARSYDQLSGQSRSSLPKIATDGTTRLTGAVSGRLRHARGGFARASDRSARLAMAEPDPFYNRLFYDVNPHEPIAPIGQKERNTDWGYWGKFFGAFGDRESTKGFTGYDHYTTGWAAGADYQITNHTLFGVTLGMANLNVDYSGSEDRTETQAQYLGLYAGHNKHFWYLDSVLTVSRLYTNTERLVDVTGERLTADFLGFEISEYVEGGWDWGEARGWLIQPMASVQVSYVHFESYAESGGPSALAFGIQDMLSIKGSAGLRMTKDLAWSRNYNGKLQLRGRWVHEFGDNASQVDAHFASGPATTFTVTDEGVDPDSVILGAGIHTDIGEGDTILLDYDMKVSDDESAHVFSGQWKHRW